MAVKPGDSILKHLTAAWYNEVTKSASPQRLTGGGSSIDQFDHLIVTVRNHSDTKRERYESVLLGSPYFDYEKPFDITHNSIVINTVDTYYDYGESYPMNDWAVLLEPLGPKIGATAKAIIKGYTWLRCTTANAIGEPSGPGKNYLFKPTEFALERAYDGKAQILSTFYVGSEVYYLILLGNTPIQRTRFFELTSNMEPVSLGNERITAKATASFVDFQGKVMFTDDLYSWDGIVDNEISGFKGEAVLMDNYWVFNQANCEQ